MIEDSGPDVTGSQNGDPSTRHLPPYTAFVLQYATKHTYLHTDDITCTSLASFL